MRTLPKPKRDANGGYHIRWREGGVNRRKNFPSAAAANAWIATEMLAESERDRVAARQTFAHYAEKYLALLAGDAKASYLKSERSKMQAAIAFFKGKPVADIKPSDCLEFRAMLQATPTRLGGVPRNATVNHAYRVLRAVLAVAVADRALASNPADVKGRKRKSTKQARFQPVFLTADEVEALAETLTEQGKAPYDLMVRFLAYTGLRAGENSGLNVGDIGLRKRGAEWTGYVDVHRNRYKLDGEWVEETPKSEKSVRKVRLPDWLAADLHEYLRTRAEASAEGELDSDEPMWPGRRPGGGVTRGARGGEGRFRLNWCEPVEMGAWKRNVFDRAASEAGLPATLRVHDLRHTMASLWLANGGDIYELSEQLGHESYQTTLKFYAHLQPKSDDAPHVFDARPEAADRTNVIPLRRRRSA